MEDSCETEVKNFGRRIFWWRKSSNKHGNHWCQWRHPCDLKEKGGMRFRCLSKFNLDLLAKQDWRLINFPNSLLACSLKAKDFPNTSFLESRLENLPSYT